MEKESKFWILTGTAENWAIDVNSSIWGVRESLKKYWDKLVEGDLLIFYATSPVSGVIGVGIAENKFKENKPFWPDELREGKAIYPYRFEFKTLYYLPLNQWKGNNISIRDLKVGYQAGMNPLSNLEVAKEIISRINNKWTLNLGKPSIIPAEKPKEKKVKEPSAHDKVKDMLYQIGILEKFISQKEYPIDSEKLDVAWRKIAEGDPRRVFEVQIGGDVHHALSKLKHANDKWNSEPFIIIEEKDRAKVNELLGGTFHEIAAVIQIITPDKVEELYDRLLRAEELKRGMGL